MDYQRRDIRFTTTEDGVSIAYWEIGKGKPVVIIQNFSISHAELEWGVPSIASFYIDLAKQHRVIRFDPRGIGLSGEPPGGWDALTPAGGHEAMSLEHMGLDISAVVEALGVESFALMGVSVQGPVAIRYAARNQQVSGLVLVETFASVASSFGAPVLKADSELRAMEAKLGQSVFSVWERFSPPDEIDQLVKLVRHANQAIADVHVPNRTQLEWQAEPFLAEIDVPTLIICSRNQAADTLPDARRLAAGIPGSQLQIVDGSFAPYWSDQSAILDAIEAFLGPEPPTTNHAGFRTVVFTDIVGSTEYVRSVGDEAGRLTVRDLEQKVASLAADHGGRVVKHLGDGSLVSFGSNSSAISFALEVQDKSSDGPLKLRVGMAAGEPIQEEGDIHGTVVAHASRIGDLGEAGEVIVSDSVRQLASGKGFIFEPRGEVTLKGFDEPERVWKVVAR